MSAADKMPEPAPGSSIEISSFCGMLKRLAIYIAVSLLVKNCP